MRYFNIILFLGIWASLFSQNVSNIRTTQSGNKVIITYSLSQVRKSQLLRITPYYQIGNQKYRVKGVLGDVGIGIFNPGEQQLVWDIFQDLPNADSIPNIKFSYRNQLLYIAYSPVWGTPLQYDKLLCNGNVVPTFSAPLGVQLGTLGRKFGGYVSVRYSSAKYPAQPDYYYHSHLQSFALGATLYTFKGFYGYLGLGYGETKNKADAVKNRNQTLYGTSKGAVWDIGFIWVSRGISRYRLPINANMGFSIIGTKPTFAAGIGTLL